MFQILKKKRKEKELFEQLEAYDPVKSSGVSHIWKDNKNKFVIAMNERICHKCCNGERMERLSKEERIFYVVQQLEIEVNNGGFSQFFSNSSGDFANELYDAFMAVEAAKTAAICKRAMEVFGKPMPSDRTKRAAFLDDCRSERVEAILSNCDDEFYKYEEDLLELNYGFILNNKGSFGDLQVSP